MNAQTSDGAKYPSGVTYYVVEHGGHLLVISPRTGQLLAIPFDEGSSRILKSNGIHLDVDDLAGAGTSKLHLSCRIPPCYENVMRVVGVSRPTLTQAIRQQAKSFATSLASPAAIAVNLHKIRRNAVVPLDQAMRELTRSKKYGRDECYMQSESDGRLLRQLGISFRLVYGVLAPANLMHAWVEIIIDDTRSMLIDQNVDFVNCFQTSLVYEFRP